MNLRQVTRAVRTATLLLSCVPLGSCALDDPVELPPFSLSQGGVTPLAGAASPEEHYEEAYGWLTKLHLNVRRSLDAQPPDYFSASYDLDRIIRKLQTMEGLLAPDPASQLREHIASYRRLLQTTESRRGGTGILADLDRLEREVRTGFSPARVQIVVSSGNAVASAPEPEEPAESLPPPMDESAAPEEPYPLPEPDEPKKAPSASPAWLLYKAWEQVHRDLLDAYRGGTETEQPYSRVLEVLRLLIQDSADSPDRATTLELCRKAYEAAHRKTEGFRRLPQGVSKENILAELETLPRILRVELDPDRK